jgi:serine/threonine protein kinase
MEVGKKEIKKEEAKEEKKVARPEGNSKLIGNFLIDKNSDNFLGRGSYAEVYLAKNIKTNTDAAVKIYKLESLQDEEDCRLLLREIEILKQIKGDQIVQMLDAVRSSHCIYVILEYCNDGELSSKMEDTMTEKDCLKVIKQIAQAFINLSHLALKTNDGKEVSVMHRDIKPANILFHNGKVKVADFGFAKMVQEIKKNELTKHTRLGTPYYMSPQILGYQPYSVKCDVWSTGVVLYECLFGKLPWKAPSEKLLLKQIETMPLLFVTKVAPDTQDLLKNMLQVKEEDRLDWQGILQHPALKHL